MQKHKGYIITVEFNKNIYEAIGVKGEYRENSYGDTKEDAIKHLKQKIDNIPAYKEMYKEKDIVLERLHIGFLDGNRIRVDSIRKGNKEKEYKIRIKVSNDILTRISNIPLDIPVKFEIYDKIDWEINIIKHSASGVIENISKDKDEWICSADLLIKVIE